jgi:hypothetical protein
MKSLKPLTVLLTPWFLQAALTTPLSAQTSSTWDIAGRLDASWRYRSENGSSQSDSQALLSGYMDATAKDKDQSEIFRFHLEGFVNHDLNGLENSGDSFYGLPDTRNHATRAFLYGAYVEAPVMSKDLMVRIGRQEIHKENALYFDGARVEFRPLNSLSGVAYAGIPVRFYESSRSGDLLLGAGLKWRIERNLSLGYDQMFFRDHNPPADPSITARNDLSILSANWNRDQHTMLRGSASWLDGEPRRAELSVFLNYPERGWWTKLHIRRQNDYGEVVSTDLSPFAVTLSDVAPYWSGGLEFHRNLTDDVDLGVGYQGRQVIEDEDIGVFNREYSRWFGTLTGQNVIRADVEAGVRADLWYSDDADIVAGGAFAAYEPYRGERFEVGTEFSMYRFDVFTGREYLDDRQIYGRMRYPISESTALRLRIARDKSQFGTDLLLQVAFTLEF